MHSFKFDNLKFSVTFLIDLNNNFMLHKDSKVDTDRLEYIQKL